ncbi:hypothetical protein M5689_007615 [Euphorbia peplus]|nr:hypothetical protein M5689_007615 [Euphorbia peplus]
MMSTQTAKLCKKGVVISIYVEKPSKRNVSSNKNYYVHQSIRHEHHQNVNTGKGLNRKLELLLYSRRLRESARPNPSVPTILNPTVRVDDVQRKPKPKKAPTCPINWKILNLNFCRSLTSVQIKKGNNKSKHNGYIKSAIKSLKVTKKKGFVSKFLSMFQKHR